MEPSTDKPLSEDYARGFAAGYDKGWQHADIHAQRANPEPTHRVRALLKALRNRWHVWWLGRPSETVIGTSDNESEGHGLELRSVLLEEGATQPIRVAVDESLAPGELTIQHLYRDGMFTKLTRRAHFRTFTIYRPLVEKADDTAPKKRRQP